MADSVRRVGGEAEHGHLMGVEVEERSDMENKVAGRSIELNS